MPQSRTVPPESVDALPAAAEPPGAESAVRAVTVLRRVPDIAS